MSNSILFDLDWVDMDMDDDNNILGSLPVSLILGSANIDDGYENSSLSLFGASQSLESPKLLEDNEASATDMLRRRLEPTGGPGTLDVNPVRTLGELMAHQPYGLQSH